MSSSAGKLRCEIDVAGFQLVVIADASRVLRSVIRPSPEENRTLESCPQGLNAPLEAAVQFIDNYSRGLDAPVPPLDLSAYSDAEKNVYLACMKIPFGSTMSYGELARAVGYPRAARFAGSCMRKNRFMLFVPCHRVVPASGGVGLYSGGEDVKVAHLPFERAAGAIN